MPPGDPAAVLAVEEVSVRFGGIAALTSVSLSVGPGATTGLIGPNGAGKTTLFDVISGLRRPDRGRVLMGGIDVTRLGPKERSLRGLGRTFQRLEVFGSLTTLDNVLVAVENSGLRGGAARRRARDLLDRVGLGAVAESQADTLPTGFARLVELARALAGGPTILLLDEPSSGLDTAETRRLAALLGDLVADGLAVLLVEHDMELVMTVCHHIYVLGSGQVIGSGSPTQVQDDAAVQEAYLGSVSHAVGLR